MYDLHIDEDGIKGHTRPLPFSDDKYSMLSFTVRLISGKNLRKTAFYFSARLIRAYEV